jgi:hypothetical protein
MNKKGLILGITTTLMLGACSTVEIIKATETEPQYSAIILDEPKSEIESVVEDEPQEEVVVEKVIEEIEPIEPVVVEPIESEPCKALRVYGTMDSWELFRLLGEDVSYDWQPFLKQEYSKFWNMAHLGYHSTQGDFSFESFWNKYSDSLESWQLHCIYEIHIAPLLEGC